MSVEKKVAIIYQLDLIGEKKNKRKKKLETEKKIITHVVTEKKILSLSTEINISAGVLGMFYSSSDEVLKLSKNYCPSL